jgi:hypothetical protein
MSKKNKILLILFELGLWTACVLAMIWLYERWLIPGPHGPIHWVGMDSVLFWVGARTMLMGQSPYSAGTVQLIQSAVLGGPPQIGGDPMLFVYPAWIFLLITPWALFPLKWAIALWTGSLLFAALHLIGYLAIRWGDHHPVRTGLWAIVLAIGCLPFLTIAVTKGQISLVCLGSLFLAVHLANGIQLRPDRRIQHPKQMFTKPAKLDFTEILVGIFLALSIMKPTLTVPGVIGILIWALIERRGFIIAGFTTCIGVLFFASWLAVGNWIPDYLLLLRNAGGTSIAWSLSYLDWPWKALYAMVFIGICIFAFIRFLRTRERTQWFSAAILLGMALFPMRWIYDLLLGILIPGEMKKIGGLTAAFIVVALLAPWGMALLPEQYRWPTLVVGIPLVWALVWLTFYYSPYKLQEES